MEAELAICDSRTQNLDGDGIVAACNPGDRGTRATPNSNRRHVHFGSSEKVLLVL